MRIPRGYGRPWARYAVNVYALYGTFLFGPPAVFFLFL
jgi:hypothetical protein